MENWQHFHTRPFHFMSLRTIIYLAMRRLNNLFPGKYTSYLLRVTKKEKRSLPKKVTPPPPGANHQGAPLKQWRPHAHRVLQAKITRPTDGSSMDLGFLKNPLRFNTAFHVLNPNSSSICIRKQEGNPLGSPSAVVSIQKLILALINLLPFF